MLRSKFIALMLLFAAPLFGCSEDKTDNLKDDKQGDAACDKPVYAVATSVPTSDSTSSMYVAAVCGFDQASISLDKAVEFPGGGRMYTYEDHGIIVVHSFETNDLTRLDVSRDGAITVGPKLNLGGYGAVFANVNYFVSPTKSITFDFAGGRAIVWNPSDMTITGDFKLPSDYHPGYAELNAWYNLDAGPNKLMIPVVWTDWDNYKTWPKASALMVDTATNAIEVVEKDGCPGSIYPSVMSNGDRIFASDTWSLFFYWWDTNKEYQHSCAVRVPASGTGLDGEIIDLKTYTNGLPLGALRIDKNDVAYGAAYYPNVGDSEPDFNERMNSGDAWKIWRININSNAVGEEVAGIPGVSGNVFFVRLAGLLYVVVEEADSVVLYELPPTGPAKRAASMLGDWAVDAATVWQ